ncbi:MAG TPA: hypothetical protein VF762_15220 [Blastocatellia bacterium]|jgi:hypothetical protein
MERLPSELRAVESEIDAEYQTNRLMKLPFAVSAWNLMGVIEDAFFIPMLGREELSKQELEAKADSYIFVSQYPFRWLLRSCSPGGRAPTTFQEDNWKAAYDLIQLAFNYDRFYMAFTLASRGLIGLRLEGQEIIPEYTFPNEAQFEAYNRLVKPAGKDIENFDSPAVEALSDAVDRSLHISGDNFTVTLDSKMVRDAMDHLNPMLNQKFKLPDDWSFSRYRLVDFKQVYKAICALAFIRYLGRMKAALYVNNYYGFANTLLIYRKEALATVIARHTGQSPRVVKYVLDDLTFASQGMSPDRADPAIQPLIALNDEQCAIAPRLWFDTAAERNFMILLNRIPAERTVYLRLVGHKEELMRERMCKHISSPWRTCSGPVIGRKDLPDIDLAIIDDLEKVCLLTELKWFLGPAEIREIVEKSKEIKKGISQLLSLKNALEQGYRPLMQQLDINSTYSLGLVVISAEWIGHASVQNPEVQVISEKHFIKKLSVTKSLSEIATWLTKREYLPVEGKHYEIVHTPGQVGNWKTTWYRIKPLIGEGFMPV